MHVRPPPVHALAGAPAGVRQLLAACPEGAAAQLQEAVAESMCALGACEPHCRPAMLEQVRGALL